MEKRDIFGKKQYKELLVRPFRRNLSHYCFIAVRTNLDPLDFFSAIYQHTDFLFQLSKQNLDRVVNSVCFSFQSFEYQDTLSEHRAFCFVNKSVNKEQYLFGKNKNACYFLPQNKTENQISFSFIHEEEPVQKSREEDRWEDFKTHMQLSSVNLMGKMDYIFPVEIQTYEILKPLYSQFPNLFFLNHQFVDAKNIKDIDAFFSLYEEYIDETIKCLRR